VERNGGYSYLCVRPPGVRRDECDEPERTPDLSTHAFPQAAQRLPETVSRRPDADETLRVVLACLGDMKAEDITTIDLTGKTSIGDFMVVASGRSQRHVGAVADNLVKELHVAGIKQVRVEGMRQADWVLIDAGDVIIHVFRPEVRDFYALEKMWASGASKGRAAR